MDFLTQIIVNYTQALGYWGIIVLMAIESSFIPFPSEIVIPPAAFMASQGKLDLWVVIISGIAGSLIGAVINYFVALTLGRALIFKFADCKLAKLCFLISSEKVLKAENYFLKYGNSSTFVGRLIPVIRQLISLPAGFAKMPLKNFIFFTTLGSGIWVSILAIAGYTLGANYEVILKYYKILILVVVAVLGCWMYVRFKKKPSQAL